jgi:hypothetical protein
VNSVGDLQSRPQDVLHPLTDSRVRTRFTFVHALDEPLVHVDADCNSIAWMPAVVQVVSVIRIIDIYIIAVVPVVGPIFGPRVNEAEPKAAVLEAGIPTNNQDGKTIDAEPVITPKMPTEAVLRNAVAGVTAALPPVTVLGLPAMCATLLPSAPLFAFLSMLLLL